MSDLREEIIDLVLDIIELEKGEIGLDDPFSNFEGIDSLKALDVLMALEKKFKMSFPEKVVAEFTTINKVIEVAERCVPALHN